MMRLNLKWLKLFLTFDVPTNYNYIYLCFIKSHKIQRELYSNWPTNATRYQLINNYWRNAHWHFILIFFLSVLTTFFYIGSFNNLYLITSIGTGIFVYPVLFWGIYRPTFTGSFIPLLETVIAMYENRENTWLEKCKQDQLSNRALILIFYVFDKISKTNYLAPSDKCADLLHKIFGISNKSIKNELDLIFKKSKRENLAPRQIVEINKGFEEAYSILETMKFSEGVQQLKQLEQQFRQP